MTTNDLHLITTVVDGEATATELRSFEARLAADPAFAKLAAELRGDAERIRRLPCPPTPQGLANAVFTRLPLVQRRAERRPLPQWLPYAIAASLLVAVGGASFLFFAERDSQEVVANRTQQILPKNTERSPVQPPPVILAQAGPESERDVLPMPREVMIAKAPRQPDLAPMPRSVVGDLIGAGISERTKPLQAMELRLPYAGAIADFTKDDVRQRFAIDFATDAALRIDLFSKNPSAGAEALANAAKTSGIALTIDAATQDRLGKKQPFGYAVFVEGLTTEELARLLGTLAEQANQPQPPISAVHAFAAGNTEQKDWKDLFGRDLGLFRGARPESPSAMRPISDGTLGKIRNVIVKNAEKTAVLFTAYPVQARVAPVASKELKAYLDARGDRKTGTVPAFILVRPAN